MIIKQILTTISIVGLTCTAASYAQLNASGLSLLFPSSPEDSLSPYLARIESDENRTGDMFRGYSKTLSWDRMVVPYALEIGYEKTSHIIFPSSIRYVDLGNTNIIAGKAGDAENVLRIKASQPWFQGETNLAVITEDGAFYSFNVRFAEEPLKLNIEMKDFLNDGSAQNRPNNSIEVFLKELGQESPTLVHMIMQSIYRQNLRLLRHIGSKCLGVQYTVKGIYAHNDLLYFHLELKNGTAVPYNIDYITFKLTDKKLIKRITTQETVLNPVRAYNYVTRVDGRAVQRTVMAFPIFTLPKEKNLEIDLHEKDGGRHQRIIVENDDLIRARMLSEFVVQ